MILDCLRGRNQTDYAESQSLAPGCGDFFLIGNRRFEPFLHEGSRPNTSTQHFELRTSRETSAVGLRTIVI